MKIEDHETMILKFREAISLVFEGLAFANPDAIHPTDLLPEIMPSDYFSYIDFSKPIQGKIGLVINKAFLLNILKSTLGKSITQISEKEIKDLSTELVNTIAGNFLKNIPSSRRQIKIGLPVAAAGAIPEEFLKPDDGPFMLHYRFGYRHVFGILIANP